MSKNAVELTWYTLRELSVNAHFYTSCHKEIAQDLLGAVPWNELTKNSEFLYSSIQAIIHETAREKWAIRYQCPYDVSDKNGWLWIARWASHKPLKEYYEHSST